MTTGTVARAGRQAGGWRWAMWGAVAALLGAPLVAMRFTGEVNWTASDFAAAALLLGGAAVLMEVAVRTLRTPAARAAAGVAILLALGLVWAELAVQII